MWSESQRPQAQLSWARPVGEVLCPPCTSVTSDRKAPCLYVPDRKAPRPHARDGRAPPPHAPDPQREGAPTTQPRQMPLLTVQIEAEKVPPPSHSLKAQPVETVTASEKEAFLTSDPQLLQ